MARAPVACSVNTPVPCGSPAVQGGRCADHAAAAEARRGSSAARGYGPAQARARARLLRARAAAGRRGIVWACPRCGEPIPVALVPDAALHADHFRTRPPAAPDRLAHAVCNVRAAVRPGRIL